ncbi:unnamed protein product, partial [Mesorhabditis belari]|uniref:Integrator complex subunit 14 n=1 Tax=Mesorhabditis belari TaxID=2138241 RepID=A0AAF3J572_9BILA
MSFIFVVDTSLTMALTLDGQPSSSVSQSRYGAACRIISGLISRAKKITPEPKIALYRMGAKIELLSRNLEDETVAQKFLATGVRLLGESHTGELLDRISEDLSPTQDDHIIVFTDATSYDGDINFFAPCECRFVIVNTTKKGVDPVQVEELEEISAESCGYEVSEDYEDYYHLFYMTNDTTEESIVDAVAEEMFVVPVYQLRIGYLNTTITTSPPIWEDRPFEIETIGFCKHTSLLNMPVDSNHYVMLDNGKGEDVEMEDEESLQSGDLPPQKLAILWMMAEAMKQESKVTLIRFGSGRFGVLSPFNESHSGLLLSLLPPQHLLPPYVPDLEKLTTVPCFNDQCDDLVIKEEAGEPASYAANLHSWIGSNGIQNDLNKILRYFRKLPDKSENFYMELNKVRQYAAVIGCQQILSEIARILKEESIQLNEHVRKHANHVAPFLEMEITEFGVHVPDIPALP